MGAGIAVSAFSAALLNDFIMLARPIILMGSKLRPNSTVVESAIAMALIMLTFMAGLALIVIAGVFLTHLLHNLLVQLAAQR